MYMYEGAFHVEEEDQCSSCEFIHTGIACPLVQALGTGIAFLDDERDIYMVDCGFYKEFKRNLKIVR